MKFIEARLLEGPNLFRLEPALKIEFEAETGESVDVLLTELETIGAEAANLAEQAGGSATPITAEALETPNHVALILGWCHRSFARVLARSIRARVAGESPDVERSREQFERARQDTSPEQRPSMILDADRTPLTIAVTGTNGKTTTTRLIAHLLMKTGNRTAWSSTSGVYVDGEEVLAGDFSGPRGATRAIQDPTVDVAVIEVARGGILLKGISTQSVDVSVFTNISEDHLGLHGIHTVEGLARAKSTVVRITKPGGKAVLNADDPLVISSTSDIDVERILVTQREGNPLVGQHISAGGTAVISSGDRIELLQPEGRTLIAMLQDVPLTFGGKAMFQIENSICAAGAAYASGIPVEQIRTGLMSFRSDPEHNPGRLNVLALDGKKVIIDYAHNQAGVVALVDLARNLAASDGKVIAVIGAAGDRSDVALREIGALAAARADHVIVKGTTQFLRGRDLDELLSTIASGARDEGMDSVSTTPTELEAVVQALEVAATGDVIAVMAHEQTHEIIDLLTLRGASHE